MQVENVLVEEILWDNSVRTASAMSTLYQFGKPTWVAVVGSMMTMVYRPVVFG